MTATPAFASNEISAVRSKTAVFVSYSRRDASQAAREIVLKLNECGFDAYLDEKDIAPGEDWRKRLAELVLAADAMVFIITPGSAASEYCRWEVTEAERLNKRLLPVLLIPVPEDQTPAAWARRNYIFFDGSKPIQDEFNRLRKAIDTDIESVREHSRIGLLAERWHERKRSSALHLRTHELEGAEHWIAKLPQNAPQPSLLVRAFIAESRKASTRRQHRLVGGALAAVIVATAAALMFAVQSWENAELARERKELAESESAQKKIAAEQRDESVAQRQSAQRALSLFRVEQANRATAAGDAVTGMNLLLDALPDEKSDDPIQRTRPYVPDAEHALYAALQAARERVIYSSHAGAIRSAVVSADGTRVLTASNDNTAVLWNIDGTPLVTLAGHEGIVQAATFSPDGNRILTVSEDKTARLWTRDGKLHAALVWHRDAINSAVFSHDGRRILTASKDRTARLWDSDGRPLATLSGHERPVVSAIFSRDGTRVLTASEDGTARLWNLEAQLIATYSGHSAPLSSVDVSTDAGLILTTSRDGTARIWNRSGKPIANLAGHEGGIRSAEFSRDASRILTRSNNGPPRLWSADGKPLAALVGHSAAVTSATYSPDGSRILTSSADNTARLWNADGQPLATLAGHTAGVVSAVFQPDGRGVLTASIDGTARLWIEAGPLATLRATDGFSFSPDGSRILTGSRYVTRLWSRNGKLLGQFNRQYDVMFSPDGERMLAQAHNGKARLLTRHGGTLAVLTDVRRAQFSPDGNRILTFSASNLDNPPVLWNGNGELIAKLKEFKVAGGSAEFSPDGSRILASGFKEGIWLWDSEGNLLATLTGTSPMFSPDGRLILGRSAANLALVWNKDGTSLGSLGGPNTGTNDVKFSAGGNRILVPLRTGNAQLFSSDRKLLTVLEGHRSEVRSATFSRDGNRILTQSQGDPARLWSADGKLIALLEGDQLEFSPDSRRILTRSWSRFTEDPTGPKLRLWNADGRMLASSTGDGRGTASFSRDGRRFLTQSATAVRMWNSEGQLLATIDRNVTEPEISLSNFTAEFSPDGRRLAISGRNQSMAIWQVFPTTQALVDHVKSLLPRCLSAEQRQALHVTAAAPNWCASPRKPSIDASQEVADSK